MFKEKYGPWALLVGGSEGVGAAMARKLAERGLNLVLVARKPERGATLKPLPTGEGGEAFTAWKAAQTLELVEGPSFEHHLVGNGRSAMAVV